MSGNENFQYLNQINGPEDVKALNEKQVETLATEIRSFLVQTVEETGGHLASNLGVVELSVALHRVFSTPHDHIIFDVGHQSYVHKLLTGRREAFATLRQAGGLSGFTKRRESEHDCFGAGHSSTSLSAALGLARADALAGSDAYTVAVVGDGAFTGGMIHEALNNCDSHLKLIVVMNENEMSISPNHGRFADSLSKIRSRERYFLTKQATVKFLENIPLVGKAICRGLRRLKKFLKNGLYGSNYFENMGLYYLGPVDGNDMKAVEGILRMAREQNDSVIVHLKTQKGKGYAPAEENPDRYHSLPPRDEKKGEGSFSACFGKKLTAEAERDERITAITAAMRDGTGLSAFSDAYPDRFFDVGIAEEHAVTFAAGLAAGGRRPVVAIYSTFLQRAYDNIAHDVALQQLPVCFCIDRAGLNSADGPTHHGIFDVAFLSAIPHMKIYTPATYGALEAAMSEALASDMPSAIRYPRGAEERAVVERFYADGAPKSLGIRADFTPSDRPSAVVITHGRMVSEAMRAEEILAARGIRIGIILCEVIKPYDSLAAQIREVLSGLDCPVVTLEEEIRAGGFGMLLWDRLATFDEFSERRHAVIALDDNFAEQTKNESIYKTAGVDAERVAHEVELLIK